MPRIDKKHFFDLEKKTFWGVVGILIIVMGKGEEIVYKRGFTNPTLFLLYYLSIEPPTEFMI